MRTPWKQAVTSTLTEPECTKILDGFNRRMIDGVFDASGLAPSELLMLFRIGFAPTSLATSPPRRSIK